MTREEHREREAELEAELEKEAERLDVMVKAAAEAFPGLEFRLGPKVRAKADEIQTKLREHREDFKRRMRSIPRELRREAASHETRLKNLQDNLAAIERRLPKVTDEGERVLLQAKWEEQNERLGPTVRAVHEANQAIDAAFASYLAPSLEEEV